MFKGDRKVVEDQRGRFQAAVGMEAWPLLHLNQVHSNFVHWISDNAVLNEPVEGDAVGTALPGVALGVATADCVPVLMADREGRAVATAHAGWRGTSEAVVRKTVEAIVSKSGLRAGDLQVAMGPHIGVCCMEVGEDVFDWFSEPEIFERRTGRVRPHLDLGKANRLQLIAAGVPEENIQVSTLCTRCRDDLFHSYRRDGASAGRMLALIGIRP